MGCNQCELLRINGILCHEQGCPDAWKDYNRECKECGFEFKPEDSDQQFCSHSCTANYHGYAYDEDNV